MRGFRLSVVGMIGVLASAGLLVPATSASGHAPTSATPEVAAVAAVTGTVDRATAAGLAPTVNTTWSAKPLDYDNDGDQDVWVGYHQSGVVKGTAGGGRLWSNNGDGTYTWVARNAWPRLKANGRQPDRHDCGFADFDHNGLVDAYCSAGRNESNLVKIGVENELWLQDSVGAFSEHGVAWGVGDVCGRGRFVTTLDANGDGWADIFLGNETGRPVMDACDDPANGYPNEESKLFLNNGNRTGFTYAPSMIRFGAGPGQRCALTVDYDGDGWDDLVACRLKSKPPSVYHNNAGTTFSLLSPSASGVTAAAADETVADLNGDGRPDLVSANSTYIAYQLNRGSGSAPRFAAQVRIRTISTGEGRSVAVGDADGDGDQDVYAMVGNGGNAGNPGDVLLVNNGSSGFTAVAAPVSTGEADEVVALTPDGRTAQFLSLNGGGKAGGPIQLVTAR
jgi:hypothetical protein